MRVSAFYPLRGLSFALYAQTSQEVIVVEIKHFLNL